MEVNGFVHPGLEGGGNFLHRVDHGGYLDVQSFSKESSHFRGISRLGLCDQILEFGEVHLETIVLSSSYLFQVVKVISGSLCLVVRVEHVSEHLLHMIEVFVHCFDI